MASDMRLIPSPDKPAAQSSCDVLKKLNNIVCLPKYNTDPKNGSDTGSQSQVTSPEAVTSEPSLSSPASETGKSIDESLRKKTKKKKKPTKCPTVRIFVGPIVHCEENGSFCVIQNQMIGVNKGKIEFLDSVSQKDAYISKYRLTDWLNECIITLGPGCFLMPGFVDCYCQPVKALSAAFPDDDTSISLSNARSKVSLIHDDRIAKKFLRKFVERSIALGTTCALYNGSTVESAARLLTDIAASYQQRAVVGFEVSCHDYRDDRHMFQITKAWDVVQYIKRTQTERVSPCVILSHPLPKWLLERVVELKDKEDIPIVSTILGEKNEDIINKMGHWVQFEGKSALDYLINCKTFDEKTVFVNCQHCSNKNLEEVNDLGSSIVYCPSEDLEKAPYWSDVVTLKNNTNNIGLGTDIDNHYSVLGTLRTQKAVQSLRHKIYRPSTTEVITIEEDGELIEKTIEKSAEVIQDVPLAQLFYMATLGGAKVLGLEERIGNFTIGKDFDALVVDAMTSRSSFVGIHRKDTIKDLVQKFLLTGDERNVSQVYIRGERVK